MVAGTATVWLVRAGEGGRAFPACLAAGVVALRYAAVGDARLPVTVDLSPRHRSMLDAFVDAVAVGDTVLTPESRTRLVHVGRVTGPYRFADPSPVPGFRHLRPVSWHDAIPRDALPPDRRRTLDRQQTLLLLPDQPWWQALVSPP